MHVLIIGRENIGFTLINCVGVKKDTNKVMLKMDVKKLLLYFLVN